MKKTPITTSLAIIAIQALSANTYANVIEAKITDSTINNNINTQKKSIVIDIAKLNPTQGEALDIAINEKIADLMQKKSIRESLGVSYIDIIKNYGEGNESLLDSYFAEFKDEILLSAGGTADSTSSNGSPLPVPSTANNTAGSTPIVVCHTNCHCHCHGSRGWR